MNILCVLSLFLILRQRLCSALPAYFPYYLMIKPLSVHNLKLAGFIRFITLNMTDIAIKGWIIIMSLLSTGLSIMTIFSLSI